VIGVREVLQAIHGLRDTTLSSMNRAYSSKARLDSGLKGQTERFSQIRRGACPIGMLHGGPTSN
jgi:hypothetical protein